MLTNSYYVIVEKKGKRRKLGPPVFLYFRPSLECHPLQKSPPDPLDQSHPSGQANQPHPSKEKEFCNIYIDTVKKGC